MPITTKELPSCHLVVYDVSRRGGQRFERSNEKVIVGEDGKRTITEWETKKVVADADELKEASALQSSCKYALGKLGAHHPCGLIVNRDNMRAVEEAEAEWGAKISEFNNRARYSRIDFTIDDFRITSDNVATLECMLTELRNGLSDLEEAVSSFDPKSIRDVLSRLNGFSEVLPEEASKVLDDAINRARKRANDISRTEKRLSRTERAIQEEVGNGDPMEVVQEFASNKRRATKELRERAVKLAKLLKSRNEATERLDVLKRVVDTAPVRLARFAVAKPTEVEIEDRSGDLYAAEAGARFRKVSNGD